MVRVRDKFEEVWLVDFEYSQPAGENPDVICMVAQEYFSGQTMRFWRNELLSMKAPPFDTGEGALFVAYSASAEMSCFLALGWAFPRHILDLFPEYRCHSNGEFEDKKQSLLVALEYFGLPAISAEEKDEMRQLAIRGGWYTAQEKQDLLAYCESDVVALRNLLRVMEDEIDLPRALLRGKYMAMCAVIQRNGVPLDMDYLNFLRKEWGIIKSRLIEEIDPEYGVYEGESFRTDRFIEYLLKHNMGWPTHESGKPKLNQDTFKEMAILYPQVQPLKELCATLSNLRLNKLEVGKDGRNRCALMPFRAKTGRNQPSSAKFIYGPAVWIRNLIKPAEGYGIAYIDYSQQEFGIAAALSGDMRMQEAYLSGDPYLEFAKQVGALPPGATGRSDEHKVIRERFKRCALAVQYGMGYKALAQGADISTIEARRLLDLHRSNYRTFWEWSDHAVVQMALNNHIFTTLGWVLHDGSESNSRSTRNFPMQANAAEILRLVCIYGIEDGIKICAPVHDAVLIEAPIAVLDDHIERMQAVMTRASKEILGGFELRSDVKKTVFPNRYFDQRGKKFWEIIEDIRAEITSAKAA